MIVMPPSIICGCGSGVHVLQPCLDSVYCVVPGTANRLPSLVLFPRFMTVSFSSYPTTVLDALCGMIWSSNRRNVITTWNPSLAFGTDRALGINSPSYRGSAAGCSYDGYYDNLGTYYRSTEYNMSSRQCDATKLSVYLVGGGVSYIYYSVGLKAIVNESCTDANIADFITGCEIDVNANSGNSSEPWFDNGHSFDSDYEYLGIRTESGTDYHIFRLTNSITEVLHNKYTEMLPCWNYEDGTPECVTNETCHYTYGGACTVTSYNATADCPGGDSFATSVDLSTYAGYVIKLDDGKWYSVGALGPKPAGMEVINDFTIQSATGSCEYICGDPWESEN